MRRAALAARYPPTGAWPAQMRADMAAAYLDYCDTRELVAAIVRGEAPAPSSLRGSGRKREPIWARSDLDHYACPTLDSGITKSEDSAENLQKLL
jgi:hypothetical protein